MPDSAVPHYNGRSAVQLATDAELSFKGISHIIDGYEVALDPTAVYRTLSALSRALGEVPEVVTRLRAVMVGYSDKDQLTVEGGPFTTTPEAAVQAMNEAVQAMLHAFGAVDQSLYRAQAAVSEVKYKL